MTILRQPEVSFAAIAVEVLVPNTFPSRPQLVPKQGASFEGLTALVVGAGVTGDPTRL